MALLGVLLVTSVAVVSCSPPAWYSDLPLLPLVVASSNHIAEPRCRNHSLLFMDHLANFTLWAVQMLDSSAKLPGGVVDGDVHQLGHFEECLSTSYGDIQGQYCLLELTFQPLHYATPAAAPGPYNINYQPDIHVWEKLKTTEDHSKVQRSTLQWALCLPASCSPASLQQTLDHEARDFSQRTGLQVSAYVPPQRCTVSQPAPPFSLGETLYSAVVAVLVLLVATSSFYDYSYCQHEKAALVEEGSSKTTLLESVLLCFSLKKNLSGLATTVKYHPALDTMEGLRFFIMALVIVGHRLSMYNSMPTLEANQFEQFFHKVATGFLLNGTLLVDFFFMISGKLVAYHLSLHMEKTPRVNLALIFLVRFFRLTPSYMLVVFFHATVIYRLGSGPLWQEVVGLDRERCSYSWWTNLLYINNYVHPDKMCMYQSWYLSVDTQMFVVGLLLVYCMCRWPGLGYFFTAILGAASLLVPFLTTWWQRADGFLIPFSDVTNDIIRSHYFQDIYVRTENRMAPYLIGLVTGIIMCKTRKSTFRLNKWQSVVSYAAMLALLTVSFVTAYFFYKPGLPYSRVYAGLYASLSRVGLGLCFAGLSLTFTFADWKLPQNIFSWKPLRVMGRLTYGAYLLHTIGHFFDKGTRRVSQQTTVFAGVWAILADLIFSYGSAFFLMLLLESPMRALEKLAFRGVKRS